MSSEVTKRKELRRIARVIEMREHVIEGGNKDVYKGTFRGVLVAIKVKDKNNTALERYKAEIRNLGTLAHKRIVKLVGNAYLDDMNKLTIITEYLPRTLSMKLKDSEWPDWPTTVKILKQVAEGLEHIQDKNYVYADLKPENVLFDQNDDVRLASLGAAVEEGHMLLTATSDDYIPPGVRAKADKQIDVYAFGILTIQLLMRATELRQQIQPAKLSRMKGFRGKVIKPGKDESLVTRAKKLFEERNCILDEELTNHVDYSPEKGTRISHVAIECLKSFKQKKPRISAVVQQMDGI